MALSSEVRERAGAILAKAQQKLDLLKNLKPYLIDLSLRENVFGSRLGQTLEDKVAILPRLREFGFTNILLGTLDYAMGEELEVDDDFMAYLHENNIDMTGGFAFTEIGILPSGGDFEPSLSQTKMQDYGVPNTLHEIYLSTIGMQNLYDRPTLLRSLPASIQWVNDNVKGDGGGKPRIVINIVDGCDAFAEDPDWVCSVLDLIAQLQIEGVSIEDDRGTFLPFQVGAYVAAARLCLPEPLKILVHVHTGAGYENASVIEALLNGADGAWGGLPKRAAIIGHASMGELIANLVRVGNPDVMGTYRYQDLVPFSQELQYLDDEQMLPEDSPIIGTNAYRMTLPFFEQLETRFMDLPAAMIGAQAGFRVCPLAADVTVLQGRLMEVTEQPVDNFPKPVMEQMIRLMRQDLRGGTRTDYDTPDNLIALFHRASAARPRPSALA